MERRNNYELAARQAETLFLNYDQQAVIQSFSLEADRSEERRVGKECL